MLLSSTIFLWLRNKGQAEVISIRDPSWTPKCSSDWGHDVFGLVGMPGLVKQLRIGILNELGRNYVSGI